MKTIGIIIPYFGKLPAFYKAWERTARENSTVDFWLFTDCDIKEKENIHVVPCSFREIKELVQRQFEFPIALEEPYKLCDYKPAYGKIFKKWIGKYDFWGYCDIDLLFGNIRSFFTDEVLNQFERCLYLGHISLYKNCEKINKLFEFSENGGYPALNYEDVFRSNESWYFDEARGMYTKCLLNQITVYTTDKMRDPMEGEPFFYWKGNDSENQFVVLWENGQCFAVDRTGNRTELLYAHFFRRNFLVEETSERIEKIKVIPGKVGFNQGVEEKDFDASEQKGYKNRYRLNNLKKSVKRYGIIRTIWRQKWSKDHNKYIEKIKRRKNE